MERGDLAVSTRQRLIVVLEGVLANVVPLTSRGILRPKPTSWALHWLDVPLRRCVQNKRTWPDYALDIVTFVDPSVADMAAEFLMEIQFPYDVVQYHNFDKYTALLPYQPDITVIYDSDPDRLDAYGQLGRAVVKGNDFS